MERRKDSALWTSGQVMHPCENHSTVWQWGKPTLGVGKAWRMISQGCCINVSTLKRGLDEIRNSEIWVLACHGTAAPSDFTYPWPTRCFPAVCWSLQAAKSIHLPSELCYWNSSYPNPPCPCDCSIDNAIVKIFIKYS